MITYWGVRIFGVSILTYSAWGLDIWMYGGVMLGAVILECSGAFKP